MSAGLDASTVTPGRTEPEVSFTVPAIDCAAATWGHAQIAVASTRHESQLRRMVPIDSGKSRIGLPPSYSCRPAGTRAAVQHITFSYEQRGSCTGFRRKISNHEHAFVHLG